MKRQKPNRPSPSRSAKARLRTQRVAPGREIYGALVPKRISHSDLAIRISLYEPSRSPEVANVKRWNASDVDPINAWLIGEGLRLTGSAMIGIKSASGLLALYWFGNLADFVGVLGCTDPEKLFPHRERIIAMLLCIADTAYFSPYDTLEPSHPIFDGNADEWRLRQIHDSEVGIVCRESVKEAENLNARYRAQQAWTLPHDLHEEISDGALRWFGTWELNGTIQGKNRDILRFEEDRILSDAYAVAEVRALEFNLRLHLVVSLLVVWLQERLTLPRLPIPDIATWSREIIRDLSSPEARVLRAALREQICRRALDSASVPTIDIDSLVEQVATRILKQFQSGKTEITI